MKTECSLAEFYDAACTFVGKAEAKVLEFPKEIADRVGDIQLDVFVRIWDDLITSPTPEDRQLSVKVKGKYTSWPFKINREIAERIHVAASYQQA